MENIHWKSFFDFETRHQLFSAQNKQGIYYWDLVRFDVYENYLWGSLQSVAPKESSASRARRYLYYAQSVIKLLWYAGSPAENLFFVASRDKSRNGKNYDKNAADALAVLKERSYLLETFHMNDISYEYDMPSKAYCYNPNFLFRKFYRKFSYKEERYTDLANAIRDELGLDYPESSINNNISNYLADKAFYTFLLKRKKIRRVFMMQNGPIKGLIIAARSLHVPVYEFQHGIIDGGHLFYNYPKGVSTDSHVIVPDYFYSFSDFWKKGLNFPVKRIFPTGNTAFAASSLPAPTSDAQAITVVSANRFGQRLAGLTQKIALKHPERTFFFKLHPNQFPEKGVFANFFHATPNVTVVAGEFNIPDLVSRSKGVFLIQSTAAYEALQAGRAVYILAESSYYRHEHIFDCENVHLVHDEEDLESAMRQPLAASRPVFFLPFNTALFMSSLE